MVQVHYNHSVGVTRGSIVGKASEVCLTAGEWITEIEGTFSGHAISKLGFVTSKGMVFGVTANERCSRPVARYPMGTVWECEACLHVSLEPIWPAHGIAVFYWANVRIPHGTYSCHSAYVGRRDEYIRGLAATFATYTDFATPSSIVRYEQTVHAVPDAQSPAPLSKFTR